MSIHSSAKSLCNGKNCKMSKNSRVLNKEQIEIEIKQLQEQLQEKKEQLQERRELVRKENEKENIARQQCNAEMDNAHTNNWTGLRYQPKGDWERNWTTYFCLSKRYTFPKDLMIPINEYLNWLPAGCWYKIRGCAECGTVCRPINKNFCAERCKEAYGRFIIMRTIYDIYEVMQNDEDLIPHLIAYNYDIRQYDCYMAIVIHQEKLANPSSNDRNEKYDDKENSCVIRKNILKHKMFKKASLPTSHETIRYKKDYMDYCAIEDIEANLKDLRNLLKNKRKQ